MTHSPAPSARRAASTPQHTVVLLGATGRTGRRVLLELLARGVRVRAVVRSAARLPDVSAGKALLSVHEVDTLALDDDALSELLAGADAVVSCLGHTISLRGVFGPPRDLVTRAVRMVMRGAGSRHAAEPLRLILMSSVSVHLPDRGDRRRGAAERLFLWALRGLVPPARDNQRAADVLVGQAGSGLEWVVLRPDALGEGDRVPYRVHDALVHSLARPGHTRMANVAHFMGELVTDPDAWRRWSGRMPVVVDEAVRDGAAAR